MRHIFCIVFGYLFGSLSPAALLGKIKNKDLRANGTGNLGATNASMVLGKSAGLFVMIFDIFKGFFSVKLARFILPNSLWVSVLSGFCSVIGHCFPFYMHFKGGKGLAAFGGVVLAYNPLLFLFILVSGAAIVMISNIGTTLSLYSPTAFAIYSIATERDVPTLVVCVSLALFLIAMFIPNLIKVIRGEEISSKEFLNLHFGKKSELEK